MQHERILASDLARSPLCCLVSCIGEKSKASIKGASEGFLFVGDNGLYMACALSHFGIGIAKNVYHSRNDLCQEGVLDAEGLASMPYRATEDSAEDVAATIRTGGCSVGDSTGQAANMVGDDSVGNVGGVVQFSAVRWGITRLLDCLEDWRPEIGVVVARLLLEHSDKAFKSISSIHVLCGKWEERLGRIAVEPG